MKALILFLISSTVFSGILSSDPTNYMIDEFETTSSEINELKFNKVVMEIYSLYIQKALKNKLKLRVHTNWSSPYFSAWASKKQDIYKINFWGGLARINSMTLESWEFIVCHEIGHILGGKPKMRIKGHSWASAEGQADHFAITECLPNYYKTFKKTKDTQTYIQDLDYYKCFSMDDTNKCIRVLNAGHAFSNVLEFLNHDKNILKATYDKTAPHVLNTLFDSYPSNQCRLDIFNKNATCDNKSLCERNLCWFSKD